MGVIVKRTDWRPFDILPPLMITHPFSLLLSPLTLDDDIASSRASFPPLTLSRSRHPKTAVRENGSKNIENQGRTTLDRIFCTLVGGVRGIIVVVAVVVVETRVRF